MSQLNKIQVPLLDLSPEIETLWDDLNDAVQRVLRSGQFVLGREVKAFEEEISDYLEVGYAVGVNSGTDALVIGLRALGIGPGDEVITTPFTFFATAEAISNVGAAPRFVDIDPVTFNLDPEKIEEHITPDTRAIVPVHLFGHAVDMDPIAALAHKHSLKIIEDVAQAFSGEYRGKKLGTIGDIGAFSFFPSKNLGAYGDGGLIVTDDENTAELARMLRAHGSKSKYFNELFGYNSRLDELQAAILRIKLVHIETASEGRREAAACYNDLLGSIPGVICPMEMPYTKHVYHQYSIRITNGKRDVIANKLQADGVGTAVYYPVPVSHLPMYSDVADDHLIEADKAAAEVLSLPIWPQISPDTQKRVVHCLRDALEGI